MTRSEMAVAGTWAVEDFTSGPDACVECGLAPVDHTMVKKTRVDAHHALLEPVPVPAWRRAAPAYRCRNRRACEMRKGFEHG